MPDSVLQNSKASIDQSFTGKKKQLEDERDKIRAILAKRAQKKSDQKDDYITNFPNTGEELEDEVFEDEEYEVNLDIEHVLENRLKKIEQQLSELKKSE